MVDTEVWWWGVEVGGVGGGAGGGVEDPMTGSQVFASWLGLRVEGFKFGAV